MCIDRPCSLIDLQGLGTCALTCLWERRGSSGFSRSSLYRCSFLPGRSPPPPPRSKQPRLVCCPLQAALPCVWAIQTCSSLHPSSHRLSSCTPRVWNGREATGWSVPPPSLARFLHPLLLACLSLVSCLVSFFACDGCSHSAMESSNTVWQKGTPWMETRGENDPPLSCPGWTCQGQDRRKDSPDTSGQLGCDRL